MDQPALDRRLGTVGANPPCCFRTATHLVTHSSKIWPETPATSRFNRHSPDKGGRLRSLLFFTLQPHRPKTRHQKWPSETESRNDAFVARSGTRRLSLIRRMALSARISEALPLITVELRNVVAKYPFERSHRFPVPRVLSGAFKSSRDCCEYLETLAVP